MNLRKRVCIWGDSVLKGVILDENRGSYKLLDNNAVERFGSQTGLEIVNRSRFGCTVGKARDALERALQGPRPFDIALLEFGGNDCDFNWPAVAADPTAKHLPNTPLPEFVRTLQQMIDRLARLSIRPLLMSLPPIHSGSYLEFLHRKGCDRDRLLRFLGDVEQIYRFHESYSLQITRLAAQNPICVYAPVREAFLADSRGPGLLCSDGIHPNAEGHKVMESVFLKLAEAV